MARLLKRLPRYSVLVLEDDFLIAGDLANGLKSAGLSVVGPFARVGDARATLDRQAIDAAVLDVKLAETFSFALAEILLERGMPFVFATGCGEDVLPDHLRAVPRIEKPFSPDQIVEWVRTSFTAPSGTPVARGEKLSNALLNEFDDAEIARLRPHMLRVRLKRRWVLLQRHQPMERIYFPESSIGSMLIGQGDHLTEVAMIGREGAIGFPMLDSPHVPIQFIVQADGEAIAVAASELHAALQGSAHLASLFLRQQYLLTLQIANTALAHAAFSVEQRLARWLLMYEDRIGQRVLIVHEFLSLMLHARRPSVTLAIQKLEATGAIATERGQITIKSRGKLLALAGASYGTPEREQARLFPETKRNANAEQPTGAL